MSPALSRREAPSLTLPRKRERKRPVSSYRSRAPILLHGVVFCKTESPPLRRPLGEEPGRAFVTQGCHGRNSEAPTIPTVYELSVSGRHGVDLPEPDVPQAALPAGELRDGLRAAGAVAARRGAPLSGAVAAQFRRRHRLLSARLLHHEIQSQGQRGDRAARGLCRDPSAAGAGHRAGQSRRDVRAAAMARRDRRLCRACRCSPRPARMASSPGC